MKLDDVRIGVRAGDGVVARLPGVVLVVPFDGAVDPSSVDRLIEECRNGPVPGRLDDLRAVADPGVPSFALVAEVDDGLGILATGGVCVAIAGAEAVLRLTGTDVEGWSVRVPAGFGALEVGGLDGAPIDVRLDLRVGVVPGAGVVLTPAGLAAAALPGGETAIPVPTEPAPPPPTLAPAPPPTPAPPVAPAAPAESDDVPEVWGIRCKKGHFNDPEARYCGICGIHMVQDSAARVKGRRPVLGFLVLDDGMSFKLDSGYVIGSSPEDHGAVRSGRARPLVLRAEGDVISPVHARVDLEGWEVVLSDCGSVYGTYVWSPGATDWQRLGPEQRAKLGAGTRVMVAQRGFMFQPANKR